MAAGPSSKVLDKAVEDVVRRPVGRPSGEPKDLDHNLRYRRVTWDADRRVVAKWHGSWVSFFRARSSFRRTCRGGRRRWWDPTTGGCVGAVDKGGQERREVDAAVLPGVQGQLGAAAIDAEIPPQSWQKSRKAVDLSDSVASSEG